MKLMGRAVASARPELGGRLVVTVIDERDVRESGGSDSDGVVEALRSAAGADRLVSEASGIDAVIVNGRLIRQDNKDAVSANDKLPGRLLRHGRAA